MFNLIGETGLVI